MSLLSQVINKKTAIKLTNVNFKGQFGAILESADVKGLTLTGDPLMSNNITGWSGDRVALQCIGNPLTSDTVDTVAITGGQNDVDTLLSLLSNYGVEIGNVELSTAPVTSQLEYHPELNPSLWGDNNMLKSNIQEALMANAIAFREYLDLPDLPVLDVILTGSNANYNWTKHSDLDVHIVVDSYRAEQLYGPLFKQYCADKKTLWNETREVTISGLPIEVYVQDSEEMHYSSGIYSLYKNQWNVEPTFDPPQIDSYEVSERVFEYAQLIDLVVKHANKASTIERLIKKIIKMRKAGLEANGEFSVENQIFKKLRSGGYVDKLNVAKNRAIDRALSYEEEEWVKCRSINSFRKF